MATHQIFIEIEDTFVDVSHLVLWQTFTYTHRPFAVDYHAAESEANITLKYDATIYNALLVENSYFRIKIIRDSIPVWAGEFPAPLARTYDGTESSLNLSLNARDFSRRFNVDATDFLALDCKIMDPAHPTQSVVHLLCDYIGWSGADISSDVLIDIEVSAVSADDNAKGKDVLATLLYEYGWAFSFDAEGKFAPVQWMRVETPTQEANDLNIIQKDQISYGSPIDYKGATLTYYEIGEKTNIKVYSDGDLPINSDNVFTGYPILAGTSYPPATNVIDDSTGNPTIVNQEYTDGGIRYFTNKAIVQSLDYNRDAFQSDFTDIVATLDHVRDTKYESGITITHEEFFNKRARVVFDNPTGAELKLFWFDIYATVRYKTAARKSSIFNTDTPRLTQQYTAQYVFDKDHADILLKYQAALFDVGDTVHSIMSDVDWAEGSLVTVVLGEGTTQLTIVQEKTWSEQEETWIYHLRGYTQSLRGVGTSGIHSAPDPGVPSILPVPFLQPNQLFVPANFDGSGQDLTNAFTFLTAKSLGIDYTPGYTLTATPTGATGHFGTGGNYNRYTIDSIDVGTAQAIVDFTLTRTGWPTLSIVLRVTQARRGLEGETGPSGSTAFQASSSPPSSPTAGMTWLNTDDSSLSVWDGSVWVLQTDAIIPNNSQVDFYFSMDDLISAVGWSGRIVVDNQNGGEHAVLIGGETDILGMNGNGIDLDGIDGAILTSAVVDTTNDFSFSIWFRADGSYTDEKWIWVQSILPYGYLKIGHTAAGKWIWSPIASTLDFPTDGLWHHMCITWDESGLLGKLYLDGVLIEFTTGTAYPSTIPYEPLTTQFWDGAVDELRVDFRIWDQREVRGAKLLRGFTKQVTYADAQRIQAASDSVISPEEKVALKNDWLLIYNDAEDPADLTNILVSGEYNQIKSLLPIYAVDVPTVDAYLAAAEVLRAMLFDSPGILKTEFWDFNIAIDRDTYFDAWGDYRTAVYNIRAALSREVLIVDSAPEARRYMHIGVPDLSTSPHVQRYTLDPSTFAFITADEITVNIGDFAFIRHFSGGTVDGVKALMVWNGSSWTTSGITSESRAAAALDLMAICNASGYGIPSISSNIDAFSWFNVLVANQAFISQLATQMIRSADWATYGGSSTKKTELDLYEAKLRQWIRIPSNTADMVIEVSKRGFSVIIYDDSSVAATAIVNGKWYSILSHGTTDFTTIGADSNTIGETFQATGVGTGTGTVKLGNVQYLADVNGNIQAIGSFSGGERYDIDGNLLDNTKTGFFLGKDGITRIAGLSIEGPSIQGIIWGEPSIIYSQTVLSGTSGSPKIAIEMISMGPGRCVIFKNTVGLPGSFEFQAYKRGVGGWTSYGSPNVFTPGDQPYSASPIDKETFVTGSATTLHVFHNIFSGSLSSVGLGGLPAADREVIVLSATEFAVLCWTTTSSSVLKRYSYNGSSITAIGTDYNLPGYSGGGSYTRKACLVDENTIAFTYVDSVSFHHKISLVKLISGLWVAQGSDIDIDALGFTTPFDLDSLNTSDIVIASIMPTNVISVLHWNGTGWDFVETAGTITGPSGEIRAISSYSGTDILIASNGGGYDTVLSLVRFPFSLGTPYGLLRLL